MSIVQVIIPGADGMFGVLPGHVPTISELKPGVVEVTTAPGEVEKYFISSGFCFAHADSTLDVCGIEVRTRACLREIVRCPEARRARAVAPGWFL